jgi:hypothetical protein
MSLQTSFSHIDRHAAWGARPASVVVLLGLGLLAIAGALSPQVRAEPESGINPVAFAGTFAPSPCLPHDAALGTEGGDPYVFYVFNREEDLAKLRATGCPSVVAETAEAERAAPHGTAREMLAQNSPTQSAPAAP